MPATQHTFPVHIRTGLRAVAVRIAAHEPQDPSARLCAIDSLLKPAGTICSTSSGRNICELVDRATEASLEGLREQHEADVVHESLARIA